MKHQHDASTAVAQRPVAARSVGAWAAESLARWRETFAAVESGIARRLENAGHDAGGTIEARDAVDRCRRGFEQSLAGARELVEQALEPLLSADASTHDAVSTRLLQVGDAVRAFLQAVEPVAERLSNDVAARLDASGSADVPALFEGASERLRALGRKLDEAVADVDAGDATARAIQGAVLGDFSEDTSVSATVGRIVGGLNPAADVRDVVAGAMHVAQGRDGAWLDLTASAVGAVPVAGDAIKLAARALADSLGEGIGKAAKAAVTSSTTPADLTSVVERTRWRTPDDEVAEFTDWRRQEGFAGPLRSSTPGKSAHSTASREAGLEQDISPNIDEILAVGERGPWMSEAERRWRALSMNNREVKDQITNQRTKHAAVDHRDVHRVRNPREPVSLRSRNGQHNYAAIFERTFGEIREMQELVKRALKKMPDLRTGDPAALKAELNRRIWTQVRNPRTRAGRAVADAITRAGYDVIEAPDGTTVLRALSEQELRRRGLAFVDGQGWIRRAR